MEESKLDKVIAKCELAIIQPSQTIQEAVNVVIEENSFTGLPVTRCPKCIKSVDRYLYGRHGEQVNYCPFCGQALKWDMNLKNDESKEKNI